PAARFAELERTGRRELSGADAFQLYDTYGFPLDLTEVICAERGVTVDHAGYEAALERARQRSEFKGMESAVEEVYRRALETVSEGSVRFTGYERDSDESHVVALIVNGKLADRAESGAAVEVVTENTPFYAEAGGQVGDHGVIVGPSGRVEVEDTVRPVAGLVVHRGRVVEGALAQGEAVTLHIDVARRERIRRNHSATHLLHWALRTV